MLNFQGEIKDFFLDCIWLWNIVFGQKWKLVPPVTCQKGGALIKFLRYTEKEFVMEKVACHINVCNGTYSVEKTRQDYLLYHLNVAQISLFYDKNSSFY